MNPLTRRSVTAGLGAAVAAIPAGALAKPTLTSVAQDVELRELWTKYLAQLPVTTKAYDACRRVRKRSGYDAEFNSLKDSCDGNYGALHELLWKKYGLEPSYETAHREDTKLRRIVKAIRKTKSESLFGIGVKLSTWEDWENISDDEFAEVIDGVRRDIADLIAVDFIAATGEIEA